MQSIQIFLGQLAAILAVIQIVPYVRSILNGETKPSRTSYGIWLAINTVALTSYFASGATTTRWLFVVLTFNALIVFLLSLKFGVGGFSRLDISCLLLAFLAICAWLITDSPELARYIALAATILGYLPTIKKSYAHPETENTLSWGIYVVATTLNAAALTTLSPVIAAPPIVAVLMSTTILLLLQKRLNESLHHYIRDHTMGG